MTKLREKYQKEINDIIEVCMRYGELQYGASSGGNISYRVADNIVLITPTHTPKRKMTAEDICIVDLDGNEIDFPEGKKPTGETQMHLHVLRNRPDVKAVMHAHPPLLVGMSLSKAGKQAMLLPLIPEAIMLLGPIYTIPYAEPNTQMMGDMLDPYIQKGNAFILENHGVLACSCKDVLETIENVQIMESMAESILVSKLHGNKMRILDREDMEGLDRVMTALHFKMPGATGKYDSICDVFADIGGQE